MSTFRKYIALTYPLSKTLKIFEFQKSQYFHQSWKNRFLLKTKSPNKKRSEDLKSALNFDFNYVPHYIQGRRYQHRKARSFEPCYFFLKKQTTSFAFSKIKNIHYISLMKSGCSLHDKETKKRRGYLKSRH
jgi:hypothetical protein